MKEIYVDAKNLIAGRLSSFAAKSALLGDKIVIVNSEEAVITGTPKLVIEKYRYLRSETGQQDSGPNISRLPDMFLKRFLRGMLPHKQARGREAMKRIMCYQGVPDEFKDQKFISLENADITKKHHIVKYVSIGTICKTLGGKSLSRI